MEWNILLTKTSECWRRCATVLNAGSMACIHKFYTNPTPQIPSNSTPIIVSNSKSYLQGWDFEPFQLQDQNSLS